MTHFARKARSEMAEHKVVLQFEDAVEREIGVIEGETILDAALRQDIPLVHQCRSGSCSTCAAKVVLGDVTMRSTTAMSLIPSEIAEGVRLLCIAEPKSDSVVHIDYSFDHLYGGGPQKFDAKVLEFEWISGDVVRILAAVPKSLDLGFNPGQYMRVKVPGSAEWRSYSPSSSPHQLPKIEFLIRILDAGLMSDALRGGMKKGDVLEMEGPYGSFYLRDDGASHRLFLAGGTGLAPIMSMIDTIRQAPGAKKGSMLVSFGCGQQRNFFFKEELELREAWMPSLKLRLSADRIDDETAGLAEGNPVSLLVPEDAGPDTVAYLCGPPGMIERAISRLSELGVKGENIHYEQFTPSA